MKTKNPSAATREMKALDALSSRNDIVIKPADKGGAVVVMNKSVYTAEAQRQLAGATFYKYLDPTEQYKSLVQSTFLDPVKNKKVRRVVSWASW